MDKSGNNLPTPKEIEALSPRELSHVQKSWIRERDLLRERLDDYESLLKSIEEISEYPVLD